AINAIGKARDTAGSLLDYQAPAIASPGSLAPRSIAARSLAPNLVQAPLVGAAPAVNAVNVQAGQLGDTDLAPYLNPYLDNVVNATLGDLSHARDLQAVADNASATAAHAFGGTRQAVLNANSSDAYLRNVASTSAGLHQGAFQNAQAAALQDIQNRL